MLKEFIFIDETDNDRKKIFNRELYKEYIISIITDFFHSSFSENKTYLKFCNFLQDIEDYGDVYFLISEPSYHWAISIKYDTFETTEYEKEIVTNDFLNNFIEFDKFFFKDKLTQDYLVTID
ncbi:hypothetical protein [Flavobacterium covae]|nr:hypothetical protein [Flavobacterium covae]